MSGSDAEHVKQHVRVYLMVFAALGVLTIVTVALSYLDLPTGQAITLAVIVATVKASLVAAYFMHLISEEKVIHWLLILCAAFVFSVFAGPILTETGIGPLWPLPN
ncbi:MAG: cytochrome C oxidase subunit IV family protein [Myxococcales bacterium]|nr:cytochrome-c oxidase [Myxococcales bacterium]HIM02335.1 cytochrome-c oxidase [Myxococcales bacterium]